MEAERARTIVILGGSYGGATAAQVLAQGLPEDWRIVILERNSHAHHVHILPRLMVLPGHEYKAFIPYSNVFQVDKPHVTLQCQIIALNPKFVTLSRSFPEHGVLDNKLYFDYAVYALGAKLPSPLDLWGTNVCGIPAKVPSGTRIYQGTKYQGINWLKENQQNVEKSSSVLVVGGGALGIQFATDIKSIYPTKQVTLIHSRDRLLPKFDKGMHIEILNAMDVLGINVHLGERLDLVSACEDPPKLNETGQRILRTMNGKALTADLIDPKILCTGQSPNTSILKEMDPATLEPDTSMAHVLRTMQLGVVQTEPEGVNTADTTHDKTSRVDVEGLGAASDCVSVSETNRIDGLDNQELVDERLDWTGSPSDKSETLTPYPNIFVIGDAANAFGAIQAGHNAYFQAQIAAKNILKLIAHDTTDALETYQPGPLAIKVSLGLGKSVYQVNGEVGVREDDPDDLRAAAIWPYFGLTVKRDEDMYD